MTVELKPLGVQCNIQCLYCYQHPQRDVSNLILSYDMQRMKSAIEAEGEPFTMFGGEPLLFPKKDLEELWSWGFARFGRNSIQTNATLINEEYIRMFKAYKVHVGISLDGPGKLNDARWHGTLARTRESSAKSQHVIERLCQEGIPPSLIITLHRGNATRDKLPILYEWIRYLEGIGVRSVRLHLLEIENAAIRAKYALSTEENIEALLGFYVLQKSLSYLKFDLFEDMRRMLTGDDNSTTCVWNSCDPYTTRSVQGVEGDGQRSSCGRTNKDGINFVKSDIFGFERYLALYHTPQEYGGCRGCRFFLTCKGHCPGTAIDGDWRNRTEHCEVWKTLYKLQEEELKKEGIMPLSLSPKRKWVEKQFLSAWSEGQNIYISKVLGNRRNQQSKPKNKLRFDIRTEFEKLRKELQEIEE